MRAHTSFERHSLAVSPFLPASVPPSALPLPLARPWAPAGPCSPHPHIIMLYYIVQIALARTSPDCGAWASPPLRATAPSPCAPHRNPKPHQELRRARQLACERGTARRSTLPGRTRPHARLLAAWAPRPHASAAATPCQQKKCPHTPKNRRNRGNRLGFRHARPLPRRTPSPPALQPRSSGSLQPPVFFCARFPYHVSLSVPYHAAAPRRRPPLLSF